MSESLALLRVRKRRFERALRDSGGLRGDSDAAAIERRERHFVALALLPDAIFGRNFAIREGKLGAGGRVDPELLLFLAHSESRRALLNDQRRDSLLAFFRLRVDVYDRGVGRAAVRDPRLRAVHN